MFFFQLMTSRCFKFLLFTLELLCEIVYLNFEVTFSYYEIFVSRLLFSVSSLNSHWDFFSLVSTIRIFRLHIYSGVSLKFVWNHRSAWQHSFNKKKPFFFDLKPLGFKIL